MWYGDKHGLYPVVFLPSIHNHWKSHLKDFLQNARKSQSYQGPQKQEKSEKNVTKGP